MRAGVVMGTVLAAFVGRGGPYRRRLYKLI